MSRGVEILLVEDNPADARLVVEAFRDSSVINSIHHVLDGQAAIDFLRERSDDDSLPMPDIMLLDLNLPRKDGRQVLKEVRANELISRLPVIALTTSEAEADVTRCYELGANAYIVKPVDFDKFIDVVRSIDSFWLQIVTLPPQ